MKKIIKKSLILVAFSLMIYIPIWANTTINEYFEQNKFTDIKVSELVDSIFMNKHRIYEGLTYEDLSNIDLSFESKLFLEENGIDIEQKLNKFISKNDLYTMKFEEKQLYIGNLEDDIVALRNAAEANRFSKKEVKEYVDGLLKNTTVNYDNTISLYSAPTRKDPGVGFEAQSRNNFYQFTSYATLPNVNINNYNEIVWHFVSPTSDKGDTLDFGVRKGKWGWAGTLLSNATGQTDVGLNKTLYDGDRIYYNIYRGSDGLINCKLVNASNFSDVIASVRVRLNNSRNDTLAFNKQITMTWNNSKLEGSYISNGTFKDSYVYNSRGGYFRLEDRLNNNHYGTFGSYQIPSSSSYTTWYNSNYTDYVNITLPRR